MFGRERKPALDFQAVYRLAPDGRLHCEADDFTQPNGLCFSPDERTLYVNDTERAHIRAFEVAADGSLSRSRVFFEPVGTANYDEGVVDGMKCDERGNVYVTGPRGIWVIDPQGRHRRHRHAGGGRESELGWAGLERSLLRLLDIALSGANESYAAIRSRTCGWPEPGREDP